MLSKLWIGIVCLAALTSSAHAGDVSIGLRISSGHSDRYDRDRINQMRAMERDDINRRIAEERDRANLEIARQQDEANLRIARERDRANLEIARERDRINQMRASGNCQQERVVVVERPYYCEPSYYPRDCYRYEPCERSSFRLEIGSRGFHLGISSRR